MFKIGDKVRPTQFYVEDLEDLEGSLHQEILALRGRVKEVFAGRPAGNVYHVEFPEAPYFKDYWIMYDNEIEAVED